MSPKTTSMLGEPSIRKPAASRVGMSAAKLSTAPRCAGSDFFAALLMANMGACLSAPVFWACADADPCREGTSSDENSNTEYGKARGDIDESQRDFENLPTLPCHNRTLARGPPEVSREACACICASISVLAMFCDLARQKGVAFADRKSVG